MNVVSDNVSGTPRYTASGIQSIAQTDRVSILSFKHLRLTLLPPIVYTVTSSMNVST